VRRPEFCVRQLAQEHLSPTGNGPGRSFVCGDRSFVYNREPRSISARLEVAQTGVLCAVTGVTCTAASQGYASLTEWPDRSFVCGDRSYVYSGEPGTHHPDWSGPDRSFVYGDRSFVYTVNQGAACRIAIPSTGVSCTAVSQGHTSLIGAAQTGVSCAVTGVSCTALSRDTPTLIEVDQEKTGVLCTPRPLLAILRATE